MCEHGIQKYHCYDCQGKGICIHSKRRHQCRECHLAQQRSGVITFTSTYCVHNKYKALCEECGGTGICLHGRNKYKCRECGGAYFCEHDKERNKCPICDPLGHLKSVVSCRVRSALLGNKTGKTLEYLGCDILSFRSHLESKFVTGMTWDNYGEWEIDHIIPIKYNNPTLNEVVARLYWTNTQPMWKHDNASKSNRYVSIVAS